MKYSNCYNIKHYSPSNASGTQTWINLRKVKNLLIISERAVFSSPSNHHTSNNILSDQYVNHNSQSKEADIVENSLIDEIYVNQHLCFQSAKEKELKSWKDNNVFKVISYSDQKCISAQWVCFFKETDNGSEPKVHLVATGFEEDTLTLFEKQSPTASKDTLHVLLSTTASKEWQLKLIDIKTAFLQGENLKRKLYLQPPPEANIPSSHIWLLKKCVHGLTDASLMWYKRVQKFAIENGGKISATDPALFMWHEHDLIGVIRAHVDDFSCSGTDVFSKCNF